MDEFTQALWSHIATLHMVKVIMKYIWQANDHIISYKPTVKTIVTIFKRPYPGWMTMNFQRVGVSEGTGRYPLNQ